MKTAHIADLHHSPERHSKVIRILDQLKEVAPEVSLISNSGENFDHPYTLQGAFNDLLGKWEEITSICPVATIKATQGKHEKDGMVESLQRAGVKLLQPGNGYLYSSGRIDDMYRTVEINGESKQVLNQSVYPELLLFGSPHPTATNILAKNKGMSLEEANGLVNKSMADLYRRYGAMKAQYEGVKSLLVGHGVVQGKDTRELHAIKNSSIYSTEAEIGYANADFNAWGHYHIPTDFDLIKGGYLGSFAWSYNELDYKPAITIVDWDTMGVERRPLDINIKKKIWMYPETPQKQKGSGSFTEIPDLTGCDVWLVNNKTEFTDKDLKAKGAGQCKVTTEVEKEHKIRSQEVMEAESYPDKYKAVYPDATERELKVCQEFWEKDVAEGKIPVKKVITPLWVEIHGSKAFMERLGKETIKIDYRNYSNGLTMLTGPGGHGKSSLFDYSALRSILFLQPNTLISTFELGDSYIKGEIQVNDDIYRIEMLMKPHLKNPKVEYYMFKNDEPIEGINRNRKPFDEHFIKIFGTPRSYSTSVLNTQFTENDSTFDKQPINPSIMKANNIELKELFHELAGTDLKHLSQECKDREKEQLELLNKEIDKRAGVAESIPSKVPYIEKVKELGCQIGNLKAESGQMQIDLEFLADIIVDIEKLKEKNKTIDTEIALISKQILSENDTKAKLDKELSELGTIDIAEINRQLSEKETEKAAYESKLKELPEIQKRNKTLRSNHKEKVEKWETSEAAKRSAYDKELSDWNTKEQERITKNSTALSEWKTKVSEVESFNKDIETLKNRINTAKETKSLTETRRQEKIDQAVKDTEKANQDNLRIYNDKLAGIDKDIEHLESRISTGEDTIKNLKKCPECGYMDQETINTKERYRVAIEGFKESIKAKQVEKENIVKPDEVTITADVSTEDKIISDCDVIINLPVDEPKTAPEKPEEIKGVDKPEAPETVAKPEEPKYEDETVPTFDMAKYSDLKDKSSALSEERMTELKAKIADSAKRISKLGEDSRSKEAEKVEIDETSILDQELIGKLVAENNIKVAELESDIKVNKAKIADIELQEEGLVEYDVRIAKYQSEADFWGLMKDRWGQNGIPARILEYTAPYIDQLANEKLAKYYPIYKTHSETTKKDATGKKDLEVFNISVVNQETGRAKPLNCISGEERNFILQALRYAFRETKKQNTLVEWNVLFEDEPDKHVSSGQLQSFWDLVEDCTIGRKVIAISHSPEVKHRTAIAVDIREL